MTHGGLTFALGAALLLGAWANTLAPQSEDGSCSVPMARAPARTQAAALVQMNTQVARSTQESLLARARAARRGGAEPAVQVQKESQDIGAALKKGLEAMQSMIRLLQAEGADIPGGISNLGTELLECIDLLLTEEGKESWSEYASFRDAWLKAFEDLPKNTASVKEDLDKFHEDGQIRDLLSAVSQILIHASDAVLSLVPGDLGSDISLYVDSLNQAFASVCEALVDFEDGDTVAGIETLYFGLRSSTESLLPETLRNNSIYSSIVGTLDGVVSGIGQDIMDYRRRLSQAGVCRKVKIQRQRTHPKICPDGYHYDGERHCWPQAEGSEAVCWKMPPACASSFEYKGKTYSECTRANHDTPWCSHDKVHKQWFPKWSNCEQVPCSDLALMATSLEKSVFGKKPSGTIPARCDDAATSKFAEKHGGWCYAACPAGYETFDKNCWSVCPTAFSVEGPMGMLCGKNQAILTTTMLEMGQVVLDTVLDLATIVSKVDADGVDAESVGSTIHLFIDMGKPFALPLCSADVQ